MVPGISNVERGNWRLEYKSLLYRVLALREQCNVVRMLCFVKESHLLRSPHIQRCCSFSERVGRGIILLESL